MYIAQTNILTKEGFKPLSSIDNTANIAVFCLKTGEWRGFRKPSKIIRSPYHGNMYLHHSAAMHPDTAILHYNRSATMLKLRSAAEIGTTSVRLLKASTYAQRVPRNKYYRNGYVAGVIFARGYALGANKIVLPFDHNRETEQFREYFSEQIVTRSVHFKKKVNLIIPKVEIQPSFTEAFMRGYFEGILCGKQQAVLSLNDAQRIKEWAVLAGYGVYFKGSFMKVNRKTGLYFNPRGKTTKGLRIRRQKQWLFNVICDDYAVCYCAGNTIFLGK